MQTMTRRAMMLLFVMGLLAGPARWARADSAAVQIVSGNTPLCLNVSGAKRDNGTRLITWFCGSDANMQFTLTPKGEIRVYGKCVDATGGKGNNGDKIQIWDCNGGAAQKWTRTNKGEIKGVKGKCLDIKDRSILPWGELELWDCNGGNNQKWAAVTARASYSLSKGNNFPGKLSTQISQSNGQSSFTMPIGNNLANVTPLTQIAP